MESVYPIQKAERNQIEIDSQVEQLLQDVHKKFHKNSDAKHTMSRDPEPSSVYSGTKKQMTLDGKSKGKLSKRESVFFKPTEKDNKVLEELILKVWPSKAEPSRKTAVYDKHHPL